MYIYNLGLKFESITERFTNKVALTFENGEKLTYGQLNARTNQFAGYLISKGIGVRDVIAIVGIKHRDTFSLMLACLKIGASYMIFDPESPIERTMKMVNTAQPKTIVVNENQKDKFDNLTKHQKHIIIDTFEGLRNKIEGFDQENLSITHNITSDIPAYIMFTSGSTGFPKGAVITHQNVLNLIAWSIETYQIDSQDILTNVNPLFFDNSVFDFYSSLFSGAALIPFSKSTVTNPKNLMGLIDEHKCTIWFSVPTLLIFLQTMKALRKDTFKYIKRIIFGGEGYPKSKLKQLFDLYYDRAEMYNVYGPTECTCICSSYKITEDDFKDLHGYPPLGQIIPNFSYLILDEYDRETQPGEIGQLCLLGPNIGKGYYRETDRTQKSFVQYPFNSNYTEVMYKTGDLVKYHPEDGKLYISGRMDNQIKHMGYRIELEEIETALCQLDNISHAVAIHGMVKGLSRIIAVVSTRNTLDQRQLTKSLKKILPVYMVPSEIHFVDELPKNPNGKIDRKKLNNIYFPN